MTTQVFPPQYNVPLVYPHGHQLEGCPTPFFQALLQQWISEKNTTDAVAAAALQVTGTPATGELVVFSGADTVTNGDLAGDVTTSGSAITTIGAGKVTLAKMANLAANSIIGNNTGSGATPIALTVTQTTAMLNAVVGDTGSGGTKGLVPAPASGDAAAGKFLKADGTWTAPSSSGGSAAWTLVDQSGAATTGSTWTFSTNVASVNVTGLGSYNELLIISRAVTASVSGIRQILASVDGGTTFFSTSGNYVRPQANGTESNASALMATTINATTALTVLGTVSNLKGPIKRAFNNTGGIGEVLFVASTSDINAIQLINSGGGNLTGGSLYVLAR